MHLWNKHKEDSQGQSGMIKNRVLIYKWIGFLGLLAMLVLDITYLRGRIFNKEIPELTAANVMRTLVVLGSLIFITLGIIHEKGDDLAAAVIFQKPYQRRFSLISNVISILFLLLFIFIPDHFSYLSIEDGFVEWTSVFLLFGCSWFMLMSFLKTLRKTKLHWIPRTIIGLLFFGFILIAMEEISWFQRVAGLETPDAFKNNWQGETNLHNFSTLWAENIYYFGAFVFIILLPFAHLFSGEIIKKFNLTILMPGIGVCLCGAIAFAYNYTMWNTILIQISFFSSLLLLLVLAKYIKEKDKRNLLLVLSAILVVTQTVFLIFGSNLRRNWELTEYKEFFIPLIFLFYSFEVYNRVKKLPAI